MLTLIMFRSLTYAQRGARVLERAGISATIARAPQETTQRGCAYCVRIAGNRLHAALHVLEDNHIPFNSVFRQREDGGYQEVQL